MGEIQVPTYNRTQLPPGRVGAAKPPYELAQTATDKSGMIQFGQDLAGFSGDIFQKLIQVRANNEHHEFLGKVSTAQMEFEGYVRTNPGAPLAEIEKARDKLLADIDKAASGNQGQTQISVEANKNFMLNNRATIEKQADTTVGAIVMKHEQERTQLEINNAIARNDRTAVFNLIDKQAESGLIPKEMVEPLKQHYGFKLDAQIAKAQKEGAKDAIGQMMIEYAATPDEDGKPIGYDKALTEFSKPEFLAKNGISLDDAASVITHLKTLASQGNLGKEKAVEAERKTIDDIFIKPQDEFLASVDGALDTINNSEIMPVKDKEDQRKKINDRVDAINGGKLDPINQFDSDTYTELLKQVNENPQSLSVSKIGAYLGKGRNKGISSDQYKEIVNIWEGRQINKSNAEMRSRYQDILKAQFNAEIFGKVDKSESQQLYMSKADTISKWFDANPDPKPQEAQEFFNELTREAVEDGWMKHIFKHLTIGIPLGLYAAAVKAPLEIAGYGEMVGGYLEPRSKEDFVKAVGVLKGKDEKTAKKYYDKWSGKF